MGDMDILTPHSGRCPVSERDVSDNDGHRHNHPAPDTICIPAPLSQSPSLNDPMMMIMSGALKMS